MGTFELVEILKGEKTLNPRIQKITDDIEKLRHKITSSQTRLRELERQKIELENADIIATVRSMDVPPEELQNLIKRLQNPIAPSAVVHREEGEIEE